GRQAGRRHRLRRHVGQRAGEHATPALRRLRARTREAVVEGHGDRSVRGVFEGPRRGVRSDAFGRTENREARTENREPRPSTPEPQNPERRTPNAERPTQRRCSSTTPDHGRLPCAPVDSGSSEIIRNANGSRPSLPAVLRTDFTSTGFHPYGEKNGGPSGGA